MEHRWNTANKNLLSKSRIEKSVKCGEMVKNLLEADYTIHARNYWGRKHLAKEVNC